ncbi:MAG: exosortase/archaeosortase family protein [Myxococcota bacterium]
MERSTDMASGDRPGLSLSRFEIVLIVGLILIWIPGLRQLAKLWSEVEYASHGFLVPLVALWAATAHRVELAALPIKPLRGGLLLLGLAAAALLGALLLNNPTVTGLVLVGTIVLLVLSLRGAAWVKTLCFSLAYLLFMVPLPLGWVTPIIVQLQLIVSSTAVRLLQSFGVAIYREGNVMTLPGDVSLFVAEACSGITSLITLLPIGVFIAYFTESSPLRRLILVAAVIPIALAGNLLRVLLTVFLSMRVSVPFATEGPLHEWAGVGTYVIGCLALLGVGALMRRIFPEDEERALNEPGRGAHA